MGTNSVVSYCRLTDKTEVEILGEWGYLSKYRILWLAGLLCSAVCVGSPLQSDAASPDRGVRSETILYYAMLAGWLRNCRFPR
ncbi:hypothetical protein BPOR_0261g00070 [Botrytis porri]|uniref:Uncharacterized protein n=1 Tax=Botrytis porri TaxID=87229 RepID=A0A4Z1KT55_9HELO|nr:hypothetical protein BPOR_0261g00070 [Botrytis porri]